MTEDCNAWAEQEATRLAREDVAASIVQPYNQRAVLAGAWDRGERVIKAKAQHLERLLRGQGVMVEPKENG